jgi:hypothetical protein
METYFVEIVFTPASGQGRYFLRCMVQAENKEQSAEKALHHYQARHEGSFKVQCNWVVNVPKRKVFEEHWEQITGSYFPKPVTDGSSFDVIGYRKCYLDETKEDVLSTWDACNAEWATNPVYYNPSKACYIVQIHNHMNMPHDLIEFEGNTKEVYDIAMKWVEENTFHGDYYRELL